MEKDKTNNYLLIIFPVVLIPPFGRLLTFIQLYFLLSKSVAKFKYFSFVLILFLDFSIVNLY